MTTKINFKLPEMDKKISTEIQSLRKRQTEIKDKLTPLKNELKEMEEVKALIDDDLSKNKKMSMVFDSDNANIDKLEKKDKIIQKKMEKIDKEIPELTKEYNSNKNKIEKLHKKKVIKYFVDIQQLLWSLHQDTLENGTDHTELLNKIRRVLHMPPFRYTQFIEMTQNKYGFDGFVKQVNSVKN